MANKYGIDIFALNDGDPDEAMLVQRFDRLIDILDQTPSGNYLLQRAKAAGLVIIFNPDLEEFLRCHPKEDLNGKNPVIEINPYHPAPLIVQKAREHQLSAVRCDEIYDDIFLSYLAHELRHNVQQGQSGPTYIRGWVPIATIRQGHASEADAYSWQNMVELELQTLGVRSHIRENIGILVPMQKEMFDLASAEYATADESEILARGALCYFSEQEAFFNSYMNDYLDAILAYAQSNPNEPQQDISLEHIVRAMFTTAEGKPYLEPAIVQEFFATACQNMPPALKQKLALVQSRTAANVALEQN